MAEFVVPQFRAAKETAYILINTLMMRLVAVGERIWSGKRLLSCSYRLTLVRLDDWRVMLTHKQVICRRARKEVGHIVQPQQHRGCGARSSSAESDQTRRPGKITVS